MVSTSLRHHHFVELGQVGFQFHKLLVIEAVQSCALLLLCSFIGSKIQIIKGWMSVVVPGKPFTNISTMGYISEGGDPFLYSGTLQLVPLLLRLLSLLQRTLLFGWTHQACRIPAQWNISSKQQNGSLNTAAWNKWRNHQTHDSTQGNKSQYPFYKLHRCV